MYDDFYNVWGKALDFMHRRPQPPVDLGKKQPGWLGGCRSRTVQNPVYHRIALFRAGHRLDDIPRIGWVQITEEADETPVFVPAHQYAGCCRLRVCARGTDGIAVFITRGKILPVQLEIFIILAGEHGIRLGSGSNEDGAPRQYRLPG